MGEGGEAGCRREEWRAHAVGCERALGVKCRTMVHLKRGRAKLWSLLHAVKKNILKKTFEEREGGAVVPAARSVVCCGMKVILTGGLLHFFHL